MHSGEVECSDAINVRGAMKIGGGQKNDLRLLQIEVYTMFSIFGNFDLP